MFTEEEAQKLEALNNFLLKQKQFIIAFSLKPKRKF